MNSAMPPLYLNSAGLRFAGLCVGGSFVSERDQQAFIQESQFAQALCQGVVVVFSGGKDASVGQEVDFGSCLRFHGAGLLQLAGGLAFGIGLLPGKSVAPDFEIEFFAQRVDAGNSDPVQSAGNFVGRCIELSAGVQFGHDHLCGGNLLAVDVHRVDGNAAAVIDDGDRVVEMDGDFDFVRVTGERFVDRVVHHFVDQMVQAHLAGGTDVHGGTFTHRLHAAEHFDGVSVVVAVASINGSELSVFWLSFVDGSDFFRSHSAPWKGPGVGLIRRRFSDALEFASNY